MLLIFISASFPTTHWDIYTQQPYTHRKMNNLWFGCWFDGILPLAQLKCNFWVRPFKCWFYLGSDVRYFFLVFSKLISFCLFVSNENKSVGAEWLTEFFFVFLRNILNVWFWLMTIKLWIYSINYIYRIHTDDIRRLFNRAIELTSVH